VRIFLDVKYCVTVCRIRCLVFVKILVGRHDSEQIEAIFLDTLAGGVSWSRWKTISTVNHDLGTDDITGSR